MRLRILLLALALCVAPVSMARAQNKQYSPGASDTEIKIGQTMPYSGPASAWSTCGVSHARYFNYINDQGGIHGRKLKLISLDDAATPPKTVEQVRRLVEHEEVLLLFGVLGSGSLSILDYVDRKRIPNLFPSAASQRFHAPDKHSWTMGWVPSWEFEGRMFARYILANKPQAKVAVLWEDNDMSREELQGIRAGLGTRANQMIVREQSYLLTDPTVDSQVIALKAAGADTLVTIASPKFAAQTIRKVHELGWRPLHLLSYPGSAISTLEQAGLEKAVGILSPYFSKDVTDPAVRNDLDVKEYYAWKEKYYPDGDISDGCIDYSYIQAKLLVQVLKQAGDNLTRDNVMNQARNLRDVRLPLVFPSIVINTSAQDYRPIEGLVFSRFDGKKWVYFGEAVMEKTR